MPVKPMSRTRFTQIGSLLGIRANIGLPEPLPARRQCTAVDTSIALCSKSRVTQSNSVVCNSVSITEGSPLADHVPSDGNFWASFALTGLTSMFSNLSRFHAK